MCATLRASPAMVFDSVREVGLLRGTRRRLGRKTGQALVHLPRRVCGCGSCAVTVGATQAAVRAGGMRPAPPPLLSSGPFAPGVSPGSRRGPGRRTRQPVLSASVPSSGARYTDAWLRGATRVPPGSAAVATEMPRAGARPTTSAAAWLDNAKHASAERSCAGVAER